MGRLSPFSIRDRVLFEIPVLIARSVRVIPRCFRSPRSRGPTCASAVAIADLPAAVGPQITRILFAAKPPVQLVPPELHDCGSPVNIVSRKRRVAKRREQRAHLGR